MIELAEVVKKHGPEYLEKFGDRMPKELWDEHTRLENRLSGSA